MTSSIGYKQEFRKKMRKLSHGAECNMGTFFKFLIFSEAVAQRCSVKKVFLEISQNSQENTCTRASFSIKLQALSLPPVAVPYF